MSSMSEQEAMREIRREFIAETRENLTRFELALLQLEADATEEEPLQALFRSVHSIKGSCGFFQLVKIEAITHAAEHLLDRVRDRRLSLTDDISSAVLAMADVVRTLLAAVEADGSEGDLDVRPLVLRLEQLAKLGSELPPPAEALVADVGESDLLRSVDELRQQMARDGNIRVDTHLLERLMNLVGELVLSRNQVVQHADGRGTHSLGKVAQRLNQVTTEIQEVVMKTRMQPVSQLFGRFPRLIRELSRQCDKQVRLELSGGETELDKTLLEAVQDPLTHLVRNAVDHGIEPGEVRLRAGKPAQGCVRLCAYHEAGLVNIEIHDDGAGIDTDAVRAKAVAQGLLAAEAVERLTPREIWSQLFVPGFSTQEHATAVSGRGVGMDVVKTNIEKIGGSIELHSETGRGTTVRIKIPLTLAIIPALIVTCAGERYAIPQASLLEVVRLDPGVGKHRIELLQGAPVLRLRERLLPLLDLGHELGERRAAAPGEADAIVVAQASGRIFGIVVDDIHDTEEIVVKPLWKRLKGLSCYAGATVMGDGRVGLILEPVGLAQRLGVIAAQGEATPQLGRQLPTGTRRELVLVCRFGSDGRVAVPLASLARLDEIPASDVQRSGKDEVALHRGRILPLLRVADLLAADGPRRRRAHAGHDPEVLPVVVVGQGERALGLVVGAVLDVVEVELSLQRERLRHGVRGALFIQERVTELLDVEALVAHAQSGAERALGVM
jgi:two-component system chemotaxis sensor kinase CheA